jgi:hypothetical protein
MSFTHPALWDLLYHGAPGPFRCQLRVAERKSQYEWIQPTQGPTTYTDHLTKYGEGFRGIAFAVEDIEREKGRLVEGGVPDDTVRCLGRARPARLWTLRVPGHEHDRRRRSRAVVEFPEVASCGARFARRTATGSGFDAHCVFSPTGQAGVKPEYRQLSAHPSAQQSRCDGPSGFAIQLLFARAWSSTALISRCWSGRLDVELTRARDVRRCGECQPRRTNRALKRW